MYLFSYGIIKIHILTLGHQVFSNYVFWSADMASGNLRDKTINFVNLLLLSKYYLFEVIDHILHVIMTFAHYCYIVQNKSYNKYH